MKKRPAQTGCHKSVCPGISSADRKKRNPEVDHPVCDLFAVGSGMLGSVLVAR